MKIIRLSCLALVGVAGAAAAAPEPYGEISLGGTYSSESSVDETDDLDGSAIVARTSVGVRLDPTGDTTRIQGSSNYFGYFDREDRWSNGLEVEQFLRLSKDVLFSLEGSAVTNVLTLESRSADQTGLAARLRIEPGNHRVTLGAGTRRRWYDQSDSRAWAPFVEAEYRYRLGSWHSLEVESRAERVNSSLATLDYKRLSLSAFYTRPLGRQTRLRAGLTHRRWTWGARFAAGGEQRRERLWLPQIRLTQKFRRDFELEIDARRVIRRSNDERFDREGSRLAATVRKSF